MCMCSAHKVSGINVQPFNNLLLATELKLLFLILFLWTKQKFVRVWNADF